MYSQGDYKSQKEAAWAITNLTSGGSVQQLAHLVQMGVLTPFCNLLVSKDWKTVLVVLDGLTNILQAAVKMGEVERVAIMIEEVGGLDKLEFLQQNENEQVYQKAIAMIDTFFSDGVSTNMKIYYVTFTKSIFTIRFIFYKINKCHALIKIGCRSRFISITYNTRWTITVYTC